MKYEAYSVWMFSFRRQGFSATSPSFGLLSFNTSKVEGSGSANDYKITHKQCFKYFPYSLKTPQKPYFITIKSCCILF